MNAWTGCIKSARSNPATREITIKIKSKKRQRTGIGSLLFDAEHDAAASGNQLLCIHAMRYRHIENVDFILVSPLLFNVQFFEQIKENIDIASIVVVVEGEAAASGALWHGIDIAALQEFPVYTESLRILYCNDAGAVLW